MWMPILGLLACAQDASIRPPAAYQFTLAERARIVSFWNEPGRYLVEAHGGAPGGLPCVRLTPEASAWFLAYNRARGAAQAPPTESDPTGAAATSAWEIWVAAKLKYDRALALTPNTQNPTPSPHPGPLPPDLLAAAGNPPPFAAAVIPRRYIVRVDDGEPIQYTDQVDNGPRYPYFRFPQGVMVVGKPLRTLPAAELDGLFRDAGMTPFEQHVAKAVSLQEGGFESVNTYDTGYVSVGFIQFAALARGGGSLGAVLLREKTDRPDAFEQDFHRYGIDVSSDGLLIVVDPSTGAEMTGGPAALKIIDDKRLTAPFQRAGARSRAFRIAQIQTAKSSYYPADLPISVTVGGIAVTGNVSDVIHSEAGMATLFDRYVNRGNLNPLSEVLAKVMELHGAKTLAEAAAYEREIIQAMKYRADYLADRTLTQP